MAKSVLPKLLQKPDVSIEEQLQIIHPILQQSNPVRTHAKGKSRNFFRVIPVVFHKLKHIRIDHPASQDFDPPSLLAGAARISPALPAPTADEARNKHLRARHRERKERR